eukprot:gnl/MRDRNA2_/MRDRNA2_85745_c0_seq4.p1 gnl/MRDRNA2_/MRDRNA2_85745_c0~~gnl/MRDRNA2_/MRDRNA2_85745_c0_seq4.p1  ORF type:complete len:115 (-),score=7.30 gnl/MRDRNA2_/MRDRNA2_85745_c0_seq4:1015-1359(-)
MNFNGCSDDLGHGNGSPKAMAASRRLITSPIMLKFFFFFRTFQMRQSCRKNPGLKKTSDTVMTGHETSEKPTQSRRLGARTCPIRICYEKFNPKSDKYRNWLHSPMIGGKMQKK